jgi:hypothetical protein
MLVVIMYVNQVLDPRMLIVQMLTVIVEDLLANALVVKVVAN